MKKSIIVAMSANHAIGKDNKLMWHIPEDLKRFKDITNGHSVIMGRKTYESIIDHLGKPLPNRTSIVITRNENYEVESGVIKTSNIDEAFSFADKSGESEVFVIGGGEIYNNTIDSVDTIYLTRLIEVVDEADTFFPMIDFTKFNIRALNGESSPTIERKIYKGFPKKTFDHEFMILDRKS